MVSFLLVVSKEREVVPPATNSKVSVLEPAPTVLSPSLRFLKIFWEEPGSRLVIVAIWLV